MFNYTLPTKIFLLAILAVLLSFVFWLDRNQTSRSKDLQTVAQAKILASALEMYYADWQAFPSIEIETSNIQWISDQGVNQPGNKYYYRQQKFSRTAILKSEEQNYQISFRLENSWRPYNTGWSGGDCVISKFVTLKCQ